MQCEGWRRCGGAFTLGPVKWEQCTNKATVLISFTREGKQETLPGCPVCWQECVDNGMNIVRVVPIKEA